MLLDRIGVCLLGVDGERWLPVYIFVTEFTIIRKLICNTWILFPYDESYFVLGNQKE